MVITYLKKVNTTIQEDGINSTLEQIAKVCVQDLII